MSSSRFAALASRCVVVPMFRSPPGSDKPRRRIDADAARKRYGLVTLRTSGKSTYRDVLDQLKRIEGRYGVDLNTAGREHVHLMKFRDY